MTRTALALLALAGPAAAQLPPEAERTVAWYQAHPDALARVTAACRNDPGHGHSNPDCMNADAARANLAADEARRRSGLGVLQNDPEYWRLHPKELPFQLRICSAIPPSAQATNNCSAARAAAAGR